MSQQNNWYNRASTGRRIAFWFFIIVLAFLALLLFTGNLGRAWDVVSEGAKGAVKGATSTLNGTPTPGGQDTRTPWPTSTAGATTQAAANGNVPTPTVNPYNPTEKPGNGAIPTVTNQPGNPYIPTTVSAQPGQNPYATPVPGNSANQTPKGSQSYAIITLGGETYKQYPQPGKGLLLDTKANDMMKAGAKATLIFDRWHLFCQFSFCMDNGFFLGAGVWEAWGELGNDTSGFSFYNGEDLSWSTDLNAPKALDLLQSHREVTVKTYRTSNISRFVRKVDSMQGVQEQTYTMQVAPAVVSTTGDRVDFYENGNPNVKYTQYVKNGYISLDETSFGIMHNGGKAIFYSSNWYLLNYNSQNWAGGCFIDQGTWEVRGEIGNPNIGFAGLSEDLLRRLKSDPKRDSGVEPALTALETHSLEKNKCAGVTKK